MLEKVSVVVPVYNVEQYLDKCLESLCIQTYKNIDIIVVNDGSTDKSENVIDRWCKKDKRIIKINQTNGGVGKARNTGIKYALKTNENGYITFLDSDDYMQQKGIEMLIKPLVEGKADCSWGNLEEVEKKENGEYVHICNTNILKKDEIMTSDEVIMQDKYEENIRLPWRVYSGLLWGKMFRVKDWKGIQIPEDMIISEDIATTFKVMFKCKKIALIKLPIVSYHHRSDSLSKSGKYHLEKYCDDQLKSQKIRIDFYKEKKRKDLMYIAYIGLAEEILSNIIRMKENDSYKKKMLKLYRQNLKKFLKAEVCFQRKIKYILYALFINKLFVARH